MYSPLSKILQDYKKGKVEHWETHDKILRLLGVAGQSKRVVCQNVFHHTCKHFGITGCDGCDVKRFQAK